MIVCVYLGGPLYSVCLSLSVYSLGLSVSLPLSVLCDCLSRGSALFFVFPSLSALWVCPFLSLSLFSVCVSLSLRYSYPPHPNPPTLCPFLTHLLVLSVSCVCLGDPVCSLSLCSDDTSINSDQFTVTREAAIETQNCMTVSMQRAVRRQLKDLVDISCSLPLGCVPLYRRPPGH